MNDRQKTINSYRRKNVNLIEKYEFSDPVKINEWKAPNRPGIYSILMRTVYEGEKKYLPIQFCESENIDQKELLSMNPSHIEGIDEKINSEDIYVATYLMHKSSTEKRRELKDNLNNCIQ